jgi:hypothetical protein
MLPSFLTPPLELLTGEGRFEPLGETRGRWRRTQILLARELCSFEWFEQPMAKGGEGAKAARLYARTAAPFMNAGLLVRRAGDGYAIWWWDLDRIGPWLAERFGAALPVVAPETLAQPPGQDWRVIRLGGGFEAQCWRDGVLVASAWRRLPPDGAFWAAFARSQRYPPSPPPATPPNPQTLPLADRVNLGWGDWGEADRGRAARIAAGAAAVLLAGACALWLGQGLRLGQLAKAAEARAQAEQAQALAARHDDTAAQRQLAAFRAVAGGPSPVAALETALAVVRRHGLAAKAFAIDGPIVSVTLPYAAIDQASVITRELQASGAFTDVRPMSASGQGLITIRMSIKGSPAASPGE